MSLRKIFSNTGPLNSERRAKFLLISILAFFVLAPLIEDREIGALALIFNLYVTLIASTVELAENRVLLWSAIPIAAASMLLMAVSHYYPVPPLVIASWSALGLFFLLVSVSLFAYLGQRGSFTNSRLYISVSLYFMLGMTWFAAYSVINLLAPGSFTEAGVPMTGDTHWSTILYFSLTTLTTTGYGDIVAVRPAARMVAVLEAAAGVLYIAITVARLVAAAGKDEPGKQQ